MSHHRFAVRAHARRAGAIGARLRAIMVAAVAGLSFLLAAAPARAIQVRCIEASRYKHLYEIFDNDRDRFAAYFGVKASELPDGEVCRAVLVSSGVEPMKADDPENDFARLMFAVRQGGGWLATLYLASPGGNIWTGLHLGELTRLSWLNVAGVEDATLEYVPDFLGLDGPGSQPKSIPKEIQAGWSKYVVDTATFSVVKVPESRRCASACTYMYAGGIYRSGQAYFHRGSLWDSGKTMTGVLDSLSNAENRVIAFYRKMDAGDQAIQTFQSTSSETVTPATIATMPRYVSDYIKRECLKRLKQKARAFPVDATDLQCIASMNTAERRAQFRKLCPNGCDDKAVRAEVLRRVQALVPDPPKPPGQKTSLPTGRSFALGRVTD